LCSGGVSPVEVKLQQSLRQGHKEDLENRTPLYTGMSHDPIALKTMLIKERRTEGVGALKRPTLKTGTERM
jgi:hypothetical protein